MSRGGAVSEGERGAGGGRRSLYFKLSNVANSFLAVIVASVASSLMVMPDRQMPRRRWRGPSLSPRSVHARDCRVSSWSVVGETKPAPPCGVSPEARNKRHCGPGAPKLLSSPNKSAVGVSARLRLPSSPATGPADHIIVHARRHSIGACQGRGGAVGQQRLPGARKCGATRWIACPETKMWAL